MHLNDLIGEISKQYLEDLKSPDQPSVFIEQNDFKILILRGLNVSIEGLSFETFGIVITPENDCYEYNADKKDLVKLNVGLNSLDKYFAPIYSKNETIINLYQNTINKLEDQIYDQSISRAFITNWFEIKSDLVKIERYLERNINTLKIFNFNMKENDQVNSLGFQDFIDSTSIQLANTKEFIRKSDDLYDLFQSIKNERLNNNIYTLTFLSAIFLPLNLIVGFFGMNTNGMFFANLQDGTKYVVAVLIGSLALSLFGLPLLRLIDRLIFSRVLGKRNFYHFIAKKISDIAKPDL